ncbi:hypothetical protein EH207_06680 [Brenneria rubrifaciens]|uniref:IS1 family transposase n=1 Tax=Brenneria rubrifaciens TaxID=55213 RepID=A0A4V1F9N8_9GAMM|nr:hypothetical protein EH207_06680 [Brenneria rubrifaciens]
MNNLSRLRQTCRKRLDLLKPFHIGFFTTDDWGCYTREIASEKHLTGKIFTQRIERHNLNLRIHIKRLARKTICFSRSFEIDDSVIAAYIENPPYNAFESQPNNETYHFPATHPLQAGRKRVSAL